MENLQENEQNSTNKNTDKNNAAGNEQQPDPEVQNDTGYSGTTNAVSENHQDKDGYKIAIEDTMIGYDGNDEQMDMDLGDGTTDNQQRGGVDDND